MKIWALIFISIVLLGCQAGNTKPEVPTNSSYYLVGLIFGITENESGNVSLIRLARVEDAMAKKEIQYALREDLRLQAERKLTQIWNSTDSGRAPGVEFFVICLYTNIDPDVVKCGDN